MDRGGGRGAGTGARAGGDRGPHLSRRRAARRRSLSWLAGSPGLAALGAASRGPRCCEAGPRPSRASGLLACPRLEAGGGVLRRRCAHARSRASSQSAACASQPASQPAPAAELQCGCARVVCGKVASSPRNPKPTGTTTRVHVVSGWRAGGAAPLPDFVSLVFAIACLREAPFPPRTHARTHALPPPITWRASATPWLLRDVYCTHGCATP
jgi:hypothetical protein